MGIALGQRAAVAVALGAVAATLLPLPRGWALLLAEAVVFAAAVLDVRLAPRPSELRIRREAPEVVTVQETHEVSLELVNPRRWPLRIGIHDATPRSLERRPARHRVRIGGHDLARLDSTITPQRRGDHRFGPVTVRAFGPLGIAARQGTVEVPGRTRVHPRLPGRAAAELRVRRARLLTAGERLTRQRGAGSEFDSLREYHRDDEFRRINWRATARASVPISNVYREEHNQHLGVLIDCGRAMAGRVAGRSRVELAIDGAIALTHLATRVGDQVGALAFDREVRLALPARSGRAQAGRLLDGVFALEAGLDASLYRPAFASLLARQRRRSLLVLFTELGPPSAMASLFDALPVLLARHLVMVAACRDPAIEQTADGLPETSEEVYAAAAAARTLADRNETTHRLRRAGAEVLDVSADDLAGAVVDAYLRVKDRGGL